MHTLHRAHAATPSSCQVNVCGHSSYVNETLHREIAATGCKAWVATRAGSKTLSKRACCAKRPCRELLFQCLYQCHACVALWHGQGKPDVPVSISHDYLGRCRQAEVACTIPMSLDTFRSSLSSHEFTSRSMCSCCPGRQAFQCFKESVRAMCTEHIRSIGMTRWTSQQQHIHKLLSRKRSVLPPQSQIG